MDIWFVTCAPWWQPSSRRGGAGHDRQVRLWCTPCLRPLCPPRLYGYKSFGVMTRTLPLPSGLGWRLWRLDGVPHALHRVPELPAADPGR